MNNPERNASVRAQSTELKEAQAAAASNLKPSLEAVSSLTPEEQMALYEKELKENDWGHQPC